MKYYCENCGHMSDFGDFCLDCESPNMISVYQSKKNPKAGNCRGVANRFEQNDRRLAKNVAANHGDNPEKTKFTQDSAKTMYEALKIVCEDCEKLSNWEDLFNIAPPGSQMPVCPCKECFVKEALNRANGKAFQEIKKEKRVFFVAQKMYEALDEALDFIKDSCYGWLYAEEREKADAMTEKWLCDTEESKR